MALIRLAASLILLSLYGCASAPLGAPLPPARAVAEVRALEREWLDAYVNYDLTAMERIVAEDFLLTFKNGGMQTKPELLNMIAAQSEHPDPALRFMTAEVQARAHGDTVVLFGVVVVEYTDGGEVSTDTSRYTDTWVRRDGRWQVVASQLSHAGREQTQTGE